MTTKIKATVLAVIMLVLDQLSKYIVLVKLKPVSSVPVISGLFSLTYVENTGAAFGIFRGYTTLLSVITALILIVLAVMVYKGKIETGFLTYTFLLISAGGFGNLMDRILRGYVVDFLDFSSIFGFPVFNIADCCVVIGSFLVVIYMLKSEVKQSAEVKDEEI